MFRSVFARKRDSVFLLALAFVFAPAVEAQLSEQITHHLVDEEYFGARVGYIELEDVDEGSLNIGFLIGYSYFEALSLEASLDYHTATFDRFDRETYALQVGLCFFPVSRGSRVRPFLVGGIGYYFSDFDFDPYYPEQTDEHRDEFGLHGGLGTEFLVRSSPSGKDWYLTLDGRYLFTDVEKDETSSAADGVILTVGFKTHF